MERRDFLKLSAVSGATAALEGCGNPDHHLIRFIPEEDLIPGIATWKPSICTLCPAGCGTLVRVMQGEAEVVRKGQFGILKMGLAKKIEGNPAHPINQGKLCPRGQATLQVTYHPDRIKTPLKRTGARGAGQFHEISWDEAIKELVSKLSELTGEKASGFAFLTSPLRGQRANIVSNFTLGMHATRWTQFALFDDQISRFANFESFGHLAPMTADLGQTNYIISFGADFLGTWNSPVAQAIGYGHMRNGRPGQRGKLVQFESRVSQTGANADELISCPPGMEGTVALAIAHAILAEKLRPANAPNAAAAHIDGWAAGLPNYAPEKVAAQSGMSAATITRIAREAATNQPAVALIGDAPTSHTNGYFNALAVNALNSLLGSVGKPGGVLFTPPPPSAKNMPTGSLAAMIRQIQTIPDAVTVLLLYNANPIFAMPASSGVKEALERIPFIASFGSFIDETSVLADLILPDHSPLESWLDDLPPSGSKELVTSVAPPAMKPLHDTRSMPDVVLDIAQQLGGDVAKALPWKTYDEAIQASFTQLYKDKAAKNAKDADEFWKKAQDQGGWWAAEESNSASPTPTKSAPVKNVAPQFDGDPKQFPFHFLPFPSQLFYDGSLAHLPWMQEMPDPLSTVMWGTWVEMNPQTAKDLGIEQADLVEIASQHGKLQAPALVTPTIAPDCVAMPVGQGHENYTRYATNRGANPVSILAPLTIEETGTLAWAATRVKLTAVGRGKLVMFGASLEEASPELKHR